MFRVAAAILLASTAPLAAQIKPSQPVAPLNNPKFNGTVKADTLQILGPGSTGEVSDMVVKAPGVPTGKPLKDWMTSPVFAGQAKSVLNSLATTQTTPGGSVGQGAMDYDWTRTAGFGQYGNALFRYDVTAPTPAGQFDAGLTSWVTHRNLAGGQVFGGWLGANSPSSGNDYSGNPLNQTFTAGAAIGAEINVGNRWADFGRQAAPGARYIVGLQVVPDVLPAKDGPSPAVYPGTFGVMVGQSVHGHKWWTGQYITTGAVMAGGYAYLTSGGGNASEAPEAAFKTQGFFQKGLDFTGTTFSGAAATFGAGQTLAVEGGGTINLTGNLTMDGAAWTAYTPTLTAASGTITTVGATAGAFQRIGKTVIGRVNFTITTNGTAAGGLTVSLPPGLPAVGVQAVTFVEDLVTGQPAFGLIYGGATTISAIRKADGTYPGGDGRRFIASFTYQTN